VPRNRMCDCFCIRKQIQCMCVFFVLPTLAMIIGDTVQNCAPRALPPFNKQKEVVCNAYRETHIYSVLVKSFTSATLENCMPVCVFVRILLFYENTYIHIAPHLTFKVCAFLNRTTVHAVCAYLIRPRISRRATLYIIPQTFQ